VVDNDEDDLVDDLIPTNYIWTFPGLRGTLFRDGGTGDDCSHISGLQLRNDGSSGLDGIRWLSPHQGDEL